MDPSDAIEGEGDLSDLYSESPVPSSSTRTSTKRKASSSQDGSSKRHRSGDYRSLETPSQASVTSFSSLNSRTSSRQTTGFPANAVLFSRPCSIPQPPRNAQDAKETRSFRCDEIKRRCSELNEPISSPILHQLDAYHAASMISTPLTDSAWDVLLPRLLEERSALNQRLQIEVKSPPVASISGTSPSHETGLTAKEVKAANALEWDKAQKPLRDNLGQHADAIIAKSWSSPYSLTYDSCPRFAVELLLGTRQRLINAGHNEDLLMENMKWLHDNKVKPLTSQHRKELFLCNGCDIKTRFYAFDSVVQHYAAKHTNSLTSGNTVVAWQQKKWPATPPFAPDPDAHTIQGTRRTNTPGHQTSYPSALSAALTTSPHQGHMIAAPFPVQPVRPFGTGFPTGYTHGQILGGPTSPFDSQRPFWIAPTSPVGYGGYGVSPFSSSSPTAFPIPGQSSPSVPSLYRSQLDTVATIASQIWSSILHIKSVPPSVRMYTIIVHVVTSFRTRFSNEPSLELFADAVLSHPLMTPMKDVTGLSCAVCVSLQQNRSSSAQAISSRPVNKKMFLFHSLLGHFKAVHIQIARAAAQSHSSEASHADPALDWKKDMIDLPRPQVVKDLLRAANMTQAAEAIFAVAFPDAFDSPLDRYDPRRPTFVDDSELHKFQPHAYRQS